MLTFAAASQNTIHANGQSEKDAYISNGVTQQYRQNITEDIEKRLMNAVNDLAAIHCLLHQEQHVRINFLQEEQLRSELYFLKQVLSDQIKVSGMQQFERPKLLFGEFCY